MTTPTLVIIPTFNEALNIERIVGRLRRAAPEVSVLVVDDNSPDGTGQIADRIAEADAAVAVLHRVGKEGLGAAYRAGFRWGLERSFGLFVEMDADGSHAPEQLPSLLAKTAEADVVQGSRWVSGGSVVNWPWHRELISRVGSAYARLMLGVPVRDLTGGYRVYSAESLHRIGLDRVHSMGYGFQVDMLFRAHRAGLRICEVPITFAEREFGESKISAGIVVEAMLRVTGWGLVWLPTRIRNRFARVTPAPARR